MRIPFLFAAVVGLTAHVVEVTSAATIVTNIHDQTFLPANWEIVKGNGSNYASASASREVGTGVTGDAQVSTANRAAGASSFTYEVYHFKKDAPFNPAVLTLQTVQWELWYKIVPGAGGTITHSSYGELWLAAKQSAGIYLSGPSRFPPQNSVSNWQKASGTVGADTFGLALGSGPPVLNVSPTAETIYFGYLNSSGVFLSTSQVNYRTSFFDLNLTSEMVVPEPASMICIASAAFVFFVRRSPVRFMRNFS